MLIIIFTALFTISVVFYIYNKVIILRTKDGLLQRYYNARSRIFLGTFLIFFGMNQYVAYQLTFVLFISIVFILLGAYQTVHGVKETRHYRDEYRRLYPS